MRCAALALIAVFGVAGCREVAPPPTDVAPPRASTGSSGSDTACTGCVVGPLTLTAPAAERLTFGADPHADYLLTIDGDHAANLRIWLNGTPIQLPRDFSGTRHGIRLRRDNSLAIQVLGSPGSSVTLLILGGARQIGDSGGTITSPGSGATLTVSPGAIEGQLLIQLVDDSALTPRYAGLSATSHNLTIPLNAPGVAFGSSGLFTVEIPTSSSPRAGSVPYLRAIFSNVPGNWWAPSTAGPNGVLSVSIPTSSLTSFASVFGVDTLQATLFAEEFEPPASAAAEPSSGSARSSASGCQSLPSDAPPLAVPCGAPVLRPVPGSPSQTSGQVAIVLVHGWSLEVADWLDYYEAQGMNCVPDLFTGWVCVPALFGSPTLPGEVYFDDLIPLLRADFPSSPLYTFNYESYNDYAVTGGAMASLLTDETQSRGLAGFVIVAHSMGGLVSRTAERSAGLEVLIRGIITLGTPHLGTELVLEWCTLQPFCLGIGTPGGQSLARALPGPEEVPTYAHGGDIEPIDSNDALYIVPSAILCERQPPMFTCRNTNDGVVPLSSALPGFVSGARSYTDMNHTELKAGRAGSLATDRLYANIKSDLETLLASPLGDPFADRVASFRAGTYLFGAVPPAPGGESVALEAPDGLNVSIGLGGEIVLEFVDNVLIDGQGNDLQINAFLPGSGSQELDNKAQVLISADGVSYTAFPGFIGPRGTSFALDLATIGLAEARFVKIVDSGSCCLSGNPQGGGDGFNVESIEALNSSSAQALSRVRSAPASVGFPSRRGAGRPTVH